MSKIIPTLYLGLGGTGFYAISEIKKNIANKYFEGDPDFPLTSYLAIDTEFLTADKIDKMKGDVNKEDVEFITTFDASNIKDIERIETTVVPDEIKGILINPGLTGLEDFVPEGAADCIEVKGDGASGVGLVGKIALANNFSKIASIVKSTIESLLGSDTESRLKSNHLFSQYGREDRLNVFIFCSFGGGTGKGMALIIAAMLKEILSGRFYGQRQKYNIAIINYLPACFRARGRSVATDESTYHYILKNQYATYKEFEWCMSNGYNNEKFFREYFNKKSNETKTEDFINSIYNISTTLESTGTEIDSYDSVNKLVAEVFTFLVMNPDSHAILQAVSNDTQKQESAIKEKGTGLPRNRKYCRIGRYNLIMPEKQLFEYAEIFCVQKLLADFLKGGIEEGTGYEYITGPEATPEKRPEERGKKKSEEIFNIFSQHYNRCPKLNAGELHYPDARNYQLSNFINPITSQIRNFSSYSEGFAKSDSLTNAKQIIDDFCLLSIRFSGLLFARDFLKELNIDIEKKVHHLLERIKQKNDFGISELFQDLGKEDAYNGTDVIEEFQFSISEEVLRRLNTKYEEQVVNIREYTSPEKFQAASEIIATLVQPKKKNIFEKIFISVEDEKIPFPEEAKAVVYGVINTFNKQLEKLWPVFLAKEYLLYANSLNKHIERRFNKVNDFIVLLKGEESQRSAYNLLQATAKKNDSSLLQKANKILHQKAVLFREANESNIIGDNEYEFKIFAQNILPYSNIITDVHADFNRNIVDELFTSRIRVDSDELLYKAEKYCSQRLNNERFIKKDKHRWTILNYMQYLLFSDNKKERQQIEENLLKIKQRSRFLSAVDTNKFENPGAAESSFPQQNFLEISDKNFLPSNIKGWEEYTHKAKLISQENKNEITLTRVQGLIPLFAFTDLQLAQKLYHKTLHEAPSDNAKHRFKVKAHSSTFFMQGIDEPFGQTLQVDKTDIKNIWNLAFHLGIVNVNDTEQIQIINNTLQRQLQDYYDPNLSQVKYKAKTRIKVIDYQNNHVDYFHLTDTINQLIFDLMNGLAEDPDEGKYIITKYFTDIEYPILPKALFDVIANKLDKIKHGELIYFAKNVEQEYLGVHEKIYDSKMRNVVFVKSEEQLMKAYSGTKTYNTTFKRIFSGKSQKTTMQNGNDENLLSIGMDEEWLIITENDKSRSLNGEPPKKWYEIKKIYESINQTALEKNLYAKVSDTIISFEAFTKLIPRFELESAIQKIGLNKEILDTKYHVVSKQSGSSNLLTKEKQFSLMEVLELLKNDDTLIVSTEAKPKQKDDWRTWKEEPSIYQTFKHLQKNQNDTDDFFIPE
jgi:hypothetical protein